MSLHLNFEQSKQKQAKFWTNLLHTIAYNVFYGNELFCLNEMLLVRDL
jgi:hypothetical protein